MEERRLVYFVSDVHLGLRSGDPEERERRFVELLKGIPASRTKALCLLGDIWDFWYEYRDVIPKEGIRVVSQLITLVDEGVEVYFIPGNHDIWTYRFFSGIGIRKIPQPSFLEFSGKTFCLGHGDGLGGADFSYGLMLKLFNSRVAQALFSTLHPTIAYRFGTDWSTSNRKKHDPYVWKGADERLWKFSEEVSRSRDVDFFIYGHYHVRVDQALPSGGRIMLLGDWINGESPYAVFDGENLKLY